MSATPLAPPLAPLESLIDGPINLDHLSRLSAEVPLGGETALLTHIYSEAPDYRWTGAPGEGIVALDDVARAATVYLDFWQATGRRRALDLARAALNFVLHMAVGDGSFYNFVLDHDGAINRGGITSRGGLDWWTCRALRALARGYAAFRALDRPYAARLRAAYLRTEALIAARTGAVGTYRTAHGVAAPVWLPADSAALAALAALGLADFYATEPNERTATLLTALADGLAAFQLGGPGRFPWGLHPHSLAAPMPWHAWGTHEAQALARAGALLGRADWIASARREVDGFFAWQLIHGQPHALDPLPLLDGQQSYGVGCLVAASLECFRATGEPHYARLAGLHAAWLTGSNPAAAPLYDPATGRGYDGIDRIGAVNPHAGAESTIEALAALQAVLTVPEAARCLHHRAEGESPWRVLRLPTDDDAPHPRDLPFALDAPGDYFLYVGLRDATATGAVATLDGDRGWSLPANNTPEWPFPTLALLAARPIHLAAGPHRIALGGDRAPRSVAGFLVQPAQATRAFVGPDGARIHLDLDMRTGALRWRGEGADASLRTA